MQSGSVVEVTLSDDRTFKGNALGPQAWAEFFRYNPFPPEPKSEKTNEAGMQVFLSLPNDHPDYIAWLTELDRIATLQKETAWLMFFDGHLEVPDDWQVPRALQRAGVKTADDPDGRLIQYVRFTVILSVTDDEKLDEAMRNEITREEIDAQSPMFQGDEEQPTA